VCVINTEGENAPSEETANGETSDDSDEDSSQEKYKLLRVREFDWSEGAIIATMRNMRSEEDITWTVQVERESTFTWGTQITGSYTVSNKALGLEFGAEVSHSTSET
jgi:hypothetical protein